MLLREIYLIKSEQSSRVIFSFRQRKRWLLLEEYSQLCQSSCTMMFYCITETFPNHLTKFSPTCFSLWFFVNLANSSKPYKVPSTPTSLNGKRKYFVEIFRQKNLGFFIAIGDNDITQLLHRHPSSE